MEGIQNIKKLIDQVAEITDAVGDAMSDGKVDMSDFTQGARVLIALGQLPKPLMSIAKEAFDLTEDESRELVDYTKSQIAAKVDSAEDDKVERVAGFVLEAAINLSKAVSSAKLLYNDIVSKGDE